MNSQEVFRLLLLLSTLYPVKPDCRPAEEGQETTLTCTVNTAALACSGITTILEWRVNKPASVIECNSNRCGGGYSSVYGFSATITTSGSTLTIFNVSRTDPFNMETRWTCRPCTGSGTEVTACSRLEVYATPENASCTVRENTAVPGDIESMTVSCSTTKVYPEAKCSFEQRTNEGTFVTINKSPTYNHTPTTGTPVYYRSECSVDVPVAELGEGTHTFRAFIYPDVTDGRNLVTATTASPNLTLTLPEASYTCSTEIIQGYFNGKSAICICSLIPDGYPKGQAQWYKGTGTRPEASGRLLDISFDSSNPVQTYTCKGSSIIGESSGLTLTAKFAFFEQDIVIIESSTSTIDLCGETNYTNHRIPITCRVPKDKIYPAPIFSASQNGLVFDFPREGYDDTMFYLSQFYPNADIGGVYQVTCRVINKITGNTQDKGTPVTFRKPPLLPPKITITGKIYQGVNALNRITLAAGYTGDMTCRVEGGYPKAHTTQLTCGSLNVTGEDVATLTFQDGQLTKNMDGIECKCTSERATGCYDNKETFLKLDVISKNEQQGSSGENIAIPVGVSVAVLVVVVIAVILLVLVRRYRNTLKEKTSAPTKENKNVDFLPNPDDGYEVPVEGSERQDMRPEGFQFILLQAQQKRYREVQTNSIPRSASEGPRGVVSRDDLSSGQIVHGQDCTCLLLALSTMTQSIINRVTNVDPPL
ncbi:hypothetical protein PoB_002005000 [Plakobranchus ocellatus]|uniref:Ig-like domain-containing protein n=1 Tax=Plakobranchus ocellatus TaxID=259542 RepID=A0AAV3ZD64_9GAST|nr:hypothetical protein PoB_002005000 [Plakobranchus ocellatus]